MKSPDVSPLGAALADEFPMSVDDLLPILDVMSHANKHLNKATRLIQYWRKDHGASFPVKVLVPIAMTVYVVMRFKDLRVCPPRMTACRGCPRATLTSRLGLCSSRWTRR